MTLNKRCDREMQPFFKPKLYFHILGSHGGDLSYISFLSFLLKNLFLFSKLTCSMSQKFEYSEYVKSMGTGEGWIWTQSDHFCQIFAALQME